MIKAFINNDDNNLLSRLKTSAYYYCFTELMNNFSFASKDLQMLKNPEVEDEKTMTVYDYILQVLVLSDYHVLLYKRQISSP
jgi:hypothetical protein